MSQIFHEYETIVIVRPDVDDSDTTAIIEKFEGIIDNRGGHMLLRDDWGKRKLAYPIERQQKGHYVLLNHLSPAALIGELERNIRNEDRIIRFMTALVERDANVQDRLEEAAAERSRREAEAQARQEAEEAARAKAEAEAEAKAKAEAEKQAESDDQAADGDNQ